MSRLACCLIWVYHLCYVLVGASVDCVFVCFFWWVSLVIVSVLLSLTFQVSVLGCCFALLCGVFALFCAWVFKPGFAVSCFVCAALRCCVLHWSTH